MDPAPDTKRPFRIWDAKTKTHCVGRNYAAKDSAIVGMLKLAYWSKIGDAFELYDIRTAKLLMQYVRTPTSIRTITLK